MCSTLLLVIPQLSKDKLPLYKAADARHAEAHSPLPLDEVLTKASAIFRLEHKRPEAVDLQLYRSDWHSCL